MHRQRPDSAHVAERLIEQLQPVAVPSAVRIIGQVHSVDATALQAYLPGAELGELCCVGQRLIAEVVGVRQETAILSPFEEPLGIACGAEVERVGRQLEIELGDHLIGSILDGFGRPLQSQADAASASETSEGAPLEKAPERLSIEMRREASPRAPLEKAPEHFPVRLHTLLRRRQYPQYGEPEATPGKPLENVLGGERRLITTHPPHVLSRPLVSEPLPLGVRAIDALLTCGKGQRVGIFAAAGVGKSTLLGMMMQGCSADVVVLALVGERGREVREFLDRVFDKAMRQRAVIVVATSDRPVLERYKAAYVATTVAEYFRDQGKSVLLLVDSVTRYARAARQLGIAAGEPMAPNGYPPSVFASLPRLLERAGPAPRGVITGVYTVLVEGDNMNEPVADEVRSILDGHIVLSRALAEQNHYPSVDILRSISRVMSYVAPHPLQHHAAKLRQLLARYDDIDLLVRVGEYQRGHDAQADEALDKRAAIMQFLCQSEAIPVTLDETQAELQRALEN